MQLFDDIFIYSKIYTKLISLDDIHTNLPSEDYIHRQISKRQTYMLDYRSNI